MFIALADPKSIPTVITWVPRGRRNPAARPECVKILKHRRWLFLWVFSGKKIGVQQWCNNWIVSYVAWSNAQKSGEANLDLWEMDNDS